MALRTFLLFLGQLLSLLMLFSDIVSQCFGPEPGYVLEAGSWEIMALQIFLSFVGLLPSLIIVFFCHYVQEITYKILRYRQLHKTNYIHDTASV